MIKVVLGDITKETTTAIVNAANSNLLAGGGVCGAIHAAAGPLLEAECLTLGGCPTGEARITKAYSLPCEYVIHAVAPKYWDGSRGETTDLINCYRSIFSLVRQYQIKSVAIPAIGTGIYRYPLVEAAAIATRVAAEAQKEINVSVRFVCFDLKTFDAYQGFCVDLKFQQRTL